MKKAAEPASKSLKRTAAQLLAEEEDESEEPESSLVATSMKGSRKQQAIDELLKQDLIKKRQREEHQVRMMGPPPVPSSSHLADKTRLPENPAVVQKLDENEEDEVPWICPGIVVKCMNKDIADGKYNGVKAVIKRVVDEYIAELQVLESGDLLKLDQADLETVIPAINGPVLIVLGSYQGEHGVLQDVDFDKGSATLRLTDSGTVLYGMEYEWFSKLHSVDL